MCEGNQLQNIRVKLQSDCCPIEYECLLLICLRHSCNEPENQNINISKKK